MSTIDALPRFHVGQPCPIACLKWRPVSTIRPSKNPLNPGVRVSTEDLLVGDEAGAIYYYVVEWPLTWEVTRDTWPGSMILVAKVTLHSQQICGLAWSPDGQCFASGGNDNLCCLMEVSKIFAAPGTAQARRRIAGNHLDQNEIEDVQREQTTGEDQEGRLPGPVGNDEGSQAPSAMLTARNNIPILGVGSETFRWCHGAAVKAIAFCPWRKGLVATGGGSNDRCIHFYHAVSGAALATIAVSAQVTSLIWSTTRKEIVATFGYAQPDHPYRIAVFSWPACQQVAAIPWEGDLRALYAIPYPGDPFDVSTAGRYNNRAGQAPREGCIIVASSDKSVKFHEVWPCGRRAAVGGPGTLGGSDILEALDGVDKEGDIIR